VGSTGGSELGQDDRKLSSNHDWMTTHFIARAGGLKNPFTYLKKFSIEET